MKETHLNPSLSFSALFCAVLAAPGFAWAQTASPTVTDPNAAVPPVVYQSVFGDSPRGVETTSVDWKKANAEVGQFKRGHVDILNWEEAQRKAKSSASPPSKAIANKPSTTSEQSKPTTAQATPQTPAPAQPANAHEH